MRIKAIKPNASMYSIFYAVLFCGFYFSFIDGGKHSSLIRIILAVGIAHLVFLFKKDLKKLSFFNFDSFFKIVFFSFIGYLITISIFYGDWQGLRRVAVIFCFLFFVYTLTCELRFDLSKFLMIVPLVAGVIASAYLYTYLLHNGFNIYYKGGALSNTVFPLFSDYENSVSAGIHLSYLMPFCLWAYFNNKNKLLSFVYFLCVLLLLGAVFTTFSRVSWLVVAISIVLFTGFGFYKKTRYKAVFLIAPVLIASASYMFISFDYSISTGLTGRDIIWMEIIGRIDSLRLWMFGSGIGSKINFVKLSSGYISPHAHNIYLEVLYRTGLIGLSLFCVLVFLSVYNLSLKINYNQNFLWLSLLISLTVSMFFDHSNLIYSPNIMWLWFWLPFAMSIASSKQHKT